MHPGQENSTTPTFRLPAEFPTATLGRNFKPYLKVGLPYYDADTDRDRPLFKAANGQQVSLGEICQALQALLTTLNPKATAETTSAAEITVDNLDRGTLFSALENLAGIVVSCFSEWPEAYRFNLRESILKSGLVREADQICFVEEAIAAFLGQLHSHLSVRNHAGAIAPATIWQGPTLILHTGASTTQLALVDLPANIQDIAHSDFTLRSFSYAGSYLEQDIICQMLLNPESGNALRSEGSLISIDLDLPLPSEPDLPTRYLLQQRLESSPLGQKLWQSAAYIKRVLPHQDSFTLEIDEYRWVLRRQELESLVVAPFIARLNRELNTLLARLGISVEAIGQAICTGGTTFLPGVGDWLRQKLPNAKIFQESESNQSSVARGLAVLPLYPELCDRAGQQYSDYFILMELLRVFGEEPLSIGKIQNLLELKGINTRVCFSNLLEILEGYLPMGLIPSEIDRGLLTEDSWQNPDYQTSIAKKPFVREGDRTYRLNPETSPHLRQYFTKVLAQSQQKLAEPYALYWLTPTPNRNYE